MGDTRLGHYLCRARRSRVSVCGKRSVKLWGLTQA
jgi:hypothetical protein